MVNFLRYCINGFRKFQLDVDIKLDGGNLSDIPETREKSTRCS